MQERQDPAVRRRLSAPALRAFFNTARAWQLSATEERGLLGSAHYVENPLQPGRYFLHCYVARNRQQGDYALHRLRLLDFVVFGTQAGPGTVSVPADVQVELAPDPAPLERGAS